MALLGAALAPVIHCSIWEDRSIYFWGDSKTSVKPLPSEHETRGAAFGYLDAQRVIANRFGADTLSRDCKAWAVELVPRWRRHARNRPWRFLGAGFLYGLRLADNILAWRYGLRRGRLSHRLIA